MAAIQLYAWLQRPNFGDALSAAVARWALGEEVAIVERAARRKLLAVGSILQAVRPGDTVWGAGAHPIGFEDFWRAPARLEDIAVLAVRGPLTRDCLIARGVPCPAIFGDPAILLPRFHHPVSRRVAGRIGFAPHYSELEDYRRDPPAGLTLIDVTSPWPEVVDAIAACEQVISSSLHGLIVAEAYGVGAVWLRTAFAEGAIKFHDYYLATDRIARPAYSIEEALQRLPVAAPDLEPKATALLDALDRDLVRRRCATDGAEPAPLAEAEPLDEGGALRAELARTKAELSRLRLAQFRFVDEENRPLALSCVEGEAGAALLEPECWSPPTVWGSLSLTVTPRLSLPAHTEWRKARQLKFEVIIRRDRRLDEKMTLGVRLGNQEALPVTLTRGAEEDAFYSYFLVPLSAELRGPHGLDIVFELSPEDVEPNGAPASLTILSITPSV